MVTEITLSDKQHGSAKGGVLCRLDFVNDAID
jgi:hypothetical protein